jgi:hypothetical protein
MGFSPFFVARLRTGARRVVIGDNGMEYPPHGGVERLTNNHAALYSVFTTNGQSPYAARGTERYVIHSTRSTPPINSA